MYQTYITAYMHLMYLDPYVAAKDTTRNHWPLTLGMATTAWPARQVDDLKAQFPPWRAIHGPFIWQELYISTWIHTGNGLYEYATYCNIQSSTSWRTALTDPIGSPIIDLNGKATIGPGICYQHFFE